MTFIKGKFVPHKEGCKCFRCTKVAWNRGKKLSKKYRHTLSIAHIGKMTGNSHPNWRGGITPKYLDRINDPKWKMIRLKVYERDGYKCCICNKQVRGKSISCHHKIPWRISNNNSLDNLITVCRSCHMKKDLQYRINEKSACAFTIVDDRYYYPVGTHIMVNSFKKYHKDIPLIVFRQDKIDEIFNKYNINFYQAKPYFGEIVANLGYRLVCNIDADTVITGRLIEVFDKEDYEVGGAWNLNDYENASLENVTSDMYIQAGLIASTNKLFWAKWKEANSSAMKYLRKENDVLNLLVYNDSEIKKMKLKIFDKDKNYYGCKSLGRESEMYVDGKRLMLRGEQVIAYHHARGGVLPKLDFDNMPFSYEVKELLKYIAYSGVTETYASI